MIRRQLLLSVSVCLLLGCSARDFLTRRLAGDLIAASDSFKVPQQFWLRTGVISDKDYTSPEYLVFQRRGWLVATSAPCPPNIAPAPCWDVLFTPAGVEIFRGLIPNNSTPSTYFSVPIATRVLVGVTGIAKNGSSAEVDFRWRWAPMNEVGGALYPEGPQYSSTVLFKHYDDGWRVAEASATRANQGIDDALKNADPVQ